MTKRSLNEAELLLLNHWEQAALLEDTMKRVREKFAALFERVLSALGKAHPELASRRQFVTQLSDNGFFRLSNPSWHSGGRLHAPGLYLYDIRLERLAADDSVSPNVSIWIPQKVVKRIGANAAEFHAALCEDARRLYGADFGTTVRPETKDGLALYFPTIGKRELLDLFIGGDENTFVSTVVRLFEMPARMVPTLDRLLMK